MTLTEPTNTALTPHQLELLKFVLVDLRNAAVRRLQWVGHDHDSGPTVPGDLDQALDRFAIDNAHDAVAATDAALTRLIDGSYGSCESCDRRIPFERLEALPLSRWCVNCAEANHDRTARRCAS